jgi:hypothetical protein
MPGTLPHTEHGFAQTSAEQKFREQLDERGGEDSTTLRFDGPVSLAHEDFGSDPYNRTGRFERLVR